MMTRVLTTLLALALFGGAAPAADIGKPVADVKLTGADGKTTNLQGQDCRCGLRLV